MFGKQNPVQFMVFKCLFIEITADNILNFFLKQIKMSWVSTKNFEETTGLFRDEVYICIPQPLLNLDIIENDQGTPFTS